MNTPPPLPEDTDELPPERSALPKIAAIVAAIFIVGFGLCTATAERSNTAATIGAFSGFIATICFFALIVIAIIAIFRSRI